MNFTVVGKRSCRYCSSAIALLESEGHEVKYIDISGNETARELMLLNGFHSVPQVYVYYNSGWDYVGGFHDTKQFITENWNG